MVATRRNRKQSGIYETGDVNITNPIEDDDIVIEIDEDVDDDAPAPSAAGQSHGGKEADAKLPRGLRPSKSGDILDAATLEAIVGIFESTNDGPMSGHRANSNLLAPATSEWKPDVLLPQRNPRAAGAVPATKHGNSYRNIQAKKTAPPPSSKKEASKEWFKLPTQQITDEVKADLRVLRLRSAFDTKRFYRKDDTSKFPTEFHVGRVVEHASDFYSGRLTKKQRKTTMAEEVMHDEYLSAVRKKRFNKIQDEATYWSKKANKGRKTKNPRLKKKPGRKKH